jgi:hypothetical protein
MQLTVHSSKFLSLLLDPYRGLSYDIFYGGVLANAYLGTVSEEVTSWNGMISHLIVLSWRRTNAKVRPETQDASADSAYAARRRVLFIMRQTVSTKSRGWDEKLKLSLRVHSRKGSF